MCRHNLLSTSHRIVSLLTTNFARSHLHSTKAAAVRAAAVTAAAANMPADTSGAATDARTLFVRNVSFDLNASDLEGLFASIGPVRQCFLVSDKQQHATPGLLKKHKGIAFVQFALPEDAERALDELNGKDVAGRRLKIERALKRAPLQERKQKRRQSEPSGDDEQRPEQQQQHHQDQPASHSMLPDAQPPAKRLKNRHQQAPPGTTAEDKHKWLRTVALGVQHPEVYLPVAQQLAAEAGGLLEVLDPAPSEVVSTAHLTQDGCSGHVVLLVYESVKAATHAVTQLQGKQLTSAALVAAAAAAADGEQRRRKKLGRKEAKRLAKQQEQQAAAAAAAAAAAEAAAAGVPNITLWARVVSGEGAHIKKWRIILRNLAFQVTEVELHRLLAGSGSFVWGLQIPRGSDGRTRGFAFASFTSWPDAERVIKAVNGQLLRKRPVAADWAVGKAQYEELKGQQQQQQQPADGSNGGCASDKASDGSGCDGEDGDYSENEQLSEGDDEGAGLSHDDEHESDDEEGLESDESYDDEEGQLDESFEDDEDESDEVSVRDGHDNDGDDSEEDVSADADVKADRDTVATALDAVLKQQQQQQQQKKDISAGQQAEQHQGKAQQDSKKQTQRQASGPTEDKVGASQQDAAGDRPTPSAAAAVGGGSAAAAVSRTVFVRGLPLDITSQELQARFDRFGPVKACRIVMNKTTGKPKGTAFVEYKAPEAAAAAAAAAARAKEGKGPNVNVKGVTLTVDLALTQDDARRLGAEQGSAHGVQGVAGPGGKFDRRNLYLTKEGFIEEGSTAWASMSDNDRRKRKRAAEEKNVKLKSPNFAISTTRLAVRNIPVSWDERRLKEAFVAGVKQRATKENPKIVQVKILRDPERPDPAGKAGGRSRGFGFVEFNDHSHALAALRQLNNNPATFSSSERRPIVEFAVDNVKVLKLRQDKLQHQKQQRQQQAEAANGIEQGGDDQGSSDAEGASDQTGADLPADNTATAAAAAVAAAPAGASGRSEAAGKSWSAAQPRAERRQGGQQGANDAAPDQVKLTKRQVKRLKEKQRRLARQQQQQAGRPAGAGAPAAGSSPGGQQQQQQQKKKLKQDQHSRQQAAMAAAEAAKSARLAAKATRHQQQARLEDAVRGQKRRADELLDQLASADAVEGRGSGQKKDRSRAATRAGAAAAAALPPHVRDATGDSGEVKKRHKPGRAAEERLEKLVDDYKSRLFGQEGASAVQQSQQQKRALQRWFE